MTTTDSFADLADTTASTKRAGSVGGKATPPVAVETDFACTSLYPVSPEAAMRAGLEHFASLLQTFCEDLDLQANDQFISGGTTYVVYAVAKWPRPTYEGTTLVQVFLEEKK